MHFLSIVVLCKIVKIYDETTSNFSLWNFHFSLLFIVFEEIAIFKHLFAKA